MGSIRAVAAVALRSHQIGSAARFGIEEVAQGARTREHAAHRAVQQVGGRVHQLPDGSVGSDNERKRGQDEGNHGMQVQAARGCPARWRRRTAERDQRQPYGRPRARLFVALPQTDNAFREIPEKLEAALPQLQGKAGKTAKQG